MGIILACCEDLNVGQKRKQFGRAIPVLLKSLVTSTKWKKRQMSIFIAELIDAVNCAGIDMEGTAAVTFVERTISATCRSLESNPMEGQPIEEWLENLGLPKEAALHRTMKPREMELSKKKSLKPDEKLELAWYWALDLNEGNFLPDRRRTNLIANWMLYDRDASGDLSIAELRLLLHALNFDDATVSFVMGHVSSLRKLSVTFFEFDEIFSKLLNFPELAECWDKLIGREVGEDNGRQQRGHSALHSGLTSSDDDDDENDDDDDDDSSETSSSSDGWGEDEQARLQGDLALAMKRGNQREIDRARANCRKLEQQQQQQKRSASAISSTRRRGLSVGAASGSSSMSRRKHGNKKGGVHRLVSVTEFTNFLIDVQKENPDTAEDLAIDIIEKIGGHLDKESFMRYLTSPEINSVWDRNLAATVSRTMKEPMTAYFINSSHNTYLTGNQLSSDSSPDMYRRALREGCRSVEIDIWDGPMGRPIVYHGFTRTSKISFDSVIEAINDSAFAHGNPYPVTLSFELHVCLDQQEYMVDVMERIFGPRLGRPNWAPGKKPDKTVSPHNYRNKILIKSARLYPKTEEQIRREQERERARMEVERFEKLQAEKAATAAEKDRSRSQMSEKEKEQEELWADVKLPPVPKKSQVISPAAARYIAQQRAERAGGGGAAAGGAIDGAAQDGGGGKKGKGGKKGQQQLTPAYEIPKDDDDDESEESSSDDEGDTNEKRQYQRALQQLQADPMQEIKKTKTKISQRLSNLVMVEARRIPVLREEVFTSTTTPQPLQSHITSFSENRSRKMIKQQAALYSKLCRRQLVRVYPHAARFDSSNFHPQDHWNVGAQMTAMNWQSDDYIARYAKTRFALDNGNCGYLLKPAAMRIPSTDANAPPPLTAQTPGVMLSLRILSAFALPKPEGASAVSEVIDPYCLAFIEGPFQAGPARQAKTSVIDDNGFHPVWKGSGTETSAWRVPVPEMSTLVLQVYDEDVSEDDFLAEAFIPVDKIRSGFRLVTLTNTKLKNVPNAFVLLQVLAEDQRTGKPLDPTGGENGPGKQKKTAGGSQKGGGSEAGSRSSRAGRSQSAAAETPTTAIKVGGRTINLTDLAAREIEQVVTGENSTNSPRQTAEWIDDTLRRQQEPSRAGSVFSPESRAQSVVSSVAPSSASPHHQNHLLHQRSARAGTTTHSQQNYGGGGGAAPAAASSASSAVSPSSRRPHYRQHEAGSDDFSAISNAMDNLFASNSGFSPSSKLPPPEHRHNHYHVPSQLKEQQQTWPKNNNNSSSSNINANNRRVRQVVTSRVTRVVGKKSETAGGGGDDVEMPLLNRQDAVASSVAAQPSSPSRGGGDERSRRSSATSRRSQQPRQYVPQDDDDDDDDNGDSFSNSRQSRGVSRASSRML